MLWTGTGNKCAMTNALHNGIIGSIAIATTAVMETTNTPKHFVLQLGSLISLYVSLVAIVMLLFGIVNIAFADPTEDFFVRDMTEHSMRFGIALLVVFFPAYLVLTRMVNVARRKETGTYRMLTRWLVYLSLLVGGGILLGDLAAVILWYLNGELTIRFALKAAVLFAVIGTAFSYYLLDVRGYWQRNERASLWCGGAAGVFVAVAVALGAFFISSPAEVRQERIDATQITHLQEMQWEVEAYYKKNGRLPDTIHAAYEVREVPEAVEGRAAYEYRVTGQHSFELCATFALASPDRRPAVPHLNVEPGVLQNPHEWDYKEGRWCFTRIIGE